MKDLLNKLMKPLASKKSTCSAGNCPGRLSISLGGSFQTAQDDVTKDSIDLRINLNVSDDLVNDVFQRMELESIVTPPAAPTITVVLDAVSGTYNAYAPGKVLRVRGDNLFILDPADPAQGVFMQPTDGSTPPVKMPEMVHNGTVELEVIVPDGIVGPQELSVATRYTQTGGLRQGKHVEPLTQL